MERNTISEVTRRNLFDELRLQNVPWSGRLAESDFLARIFDLKKLPSYDYRYEDMTGDIFMHREHFIDWEDDWVYDNSRLNLLRCSDETFLNFLCEMVHPIVRLDQDEAAKLASIFNRHLANDGFEIAPQTYVSGKPIFAARSRLDPIAFSIDPAKKIAEDFSSDHLMAQITRMESSAVRDPAVAIGTAKDFLVSRFRTF